MSASAVLGATTLAGARPGHLAAAAVMAVVVWWGAAGLAGALLARPVPVPVAPRPTAGGAGVTTVLRLGNEPGEIVLMGLSLALELGPVVVLTTGRRPPEPLPDGVTVRQCSTLADGLRAAATEATTEAVLVVSGRAMVRPDACRAAAGLLGADVGWVVGRCAAFNRDRFGSDRRDTVDLLLREQARRSGLWLWETDATLLRRDLLCAHPLQPDRPLGRWLRHRAAEGVTGACTEAVLSERAAPVASGGYWPDTVARQRGAAADLADAVRSRGPSMRTRLVATGLLGRALHGWPLLAWMCAPVLLAGGFPLEVPSVRWAAALILVVLFRGSSLCRLLGVRPSLRAETVARLYDAPGSLAATGAVATARVHPPRWSLPHRPLAWMAAAATVVAAYSLLTYVPGTSGSRHAALAAVVLLAVLWSFSVRSLVEGSWDRAGFRVPLDLQAVVRPVGDEAGDCGQVHAAVVDGSAGGLAVRGPLSGLPRRARVEVRVVLSDGGTAVLEGDVASRRRHRVGRADDVVGIELAPERGAGVPAAWFAELVRAASTAAECHDHGHGHALAVEEHRPDRVERFQRIADRALIGVTMLVSLVAMAALVAVVVGFRPLVIRSSSMEPTYSVGDMVVVELVPAAELQAGDVVSRLIESDSGKDITHRVVAVERDGDEIAVETRGDANPTGEQWRAGEGELVGRVVAAVPLVGAPLTLVRTSRPVFVAAAVGVLVVAVGFARGPRSRREDRDADGRRVLVGRR